MPYSEESTTLRVQRHCMIVHKYYPTDIRVRRQSEALKAAGIEVDVLCLRRPGEPAQAVTAGVHAHRVPLRLRANVGAGVQLLEYLAFFILVMFSLTWRHVRRPYDVIQIHNLPDFLVFVALIPKLLGARVILDLHDLMPEFFQARFNGSASPYLTKLVLLQEKLACRFANHVITVTELWRQTLIARGVPADKCSVVMNLADPQIFRPRQGGDKSAKQNGRFGLIYHGYMPERYGLDLVLQAMNQVREEIPGIHFTLIGGGEHLETLKLMALELGLADGYVEILSPLPVEKLPPIIANADLGVVPYRDDVFTDTLLPTKLMEYAAMEIPAVVSRTSAITTYFDDTMVRFFTPGDVSDLAQCFLDLYADRKKLARLKEGIKGFNQHHNWHQTSSEYVALVKRLRPKA